MQWKTETARMVFGGDVVAAVERRAKRLGLGLFGIVARPLYACTTVRDGEVCGALASMSPLLEFPEERKVWRCAACGQSRGPPVSDSVPRRILQLYPLVYTCKGTVTPMRSRPMKAVVDVPPTEFAWEGAVAVLTAARPEPGDWPGPRH